ncbi:sigma-E processing peptidase SpoIIGA [Paenibacillus psychroresistens]|uniref:Sporulation sigma-E factor-processing peptidase n=1 Tax=Paenibacillus psychroresistens TaxID=1778678 RepID=A0A6B8RJ71_9BACL|nr:sigma-E processing peptidase SpoIIGA [Paenibacillus psychroresistens]QGQ95784.1 sigma-E processing peptidase SpoIIGA [Paenibacillus psychroresistens]
MIVYVDLIFFMNFVIDGVLLLATGWTRKIKMKGWRIAAGAGIGALYVIMMLFPETSILFTFIFKFIFSVFMILVSFGFGQIQRFFRTLGVFYLVNFVAAGGILGIHYLLLSSGDVMNGIWYTHTGGLSFHVKLSMGFVLIALLLVVWFYLRVTRTSQRQMEVSQWITDLRIQLDEVEFTCKGLIDTGNRLYDPLTNMPVMVVEVGLLHDYLPEVWIKRIQNAEVEQIFMELDKVDFKGQERIRLVPFRGINKGGQFMLAIKPDQVMVRNNEQWITTNKVLVGMDGGKLSSDGAYQAILHPKLIEIET